MKDYIIGIDTSAYTTSIAVVDSVTGAIVADKRKVLDVPQGQNGLRQQEAVFQHIKNFQELYKNIDIDLNKVSIVSVSSRPRNVDNSYMPVFIVGQNYGRVIAKSVNSKYIEYSHQENHISASIINHYKSIDGNMMAIHISGGTTEFLAVKKKEKGFAAKIIGGTKDITFGQLIDRIGTAMNFNFPCGFYMEKYINENTDIKKIKLPSISGFEFINLSGMENYYKNLYNLQKYNKETVIYSLFEYIASCIVEIINSLKKENDYKNIVITGGVASNSVIRRIVENKLNNDFKLYLSPKENSSDNAIGAAYLPILDRWYNEVKTN